MFPVMPRLPAPWVLAFLAAAAAVPAIPVHGQYQRPPEPARPSEPSRPSRPAGPSHAPPEVVEQGVADRNSMQHSLRVQAVDLSPNGFERVYKVPGRDDLLMRTNGALYAVFDQSTYGRSQRGGMRAVIPAATVFYIGRPDFTTIRSSGVRDLDFAVAAAPRAARPSGALDEVHGVQRLDGAPVDGRTASPGASRVESRVDGRTAAPRGSTRDVGPAASSGSGPASVPRAAPVAAPSPVPGPAPGRDAGGSARDADPAFQKRIDELMRRARKAQ